MTVKSELVHNYEAPFTRWVVGTDILKSPFVLIDVGCQGGPQDRFFALGRCLEWHGIDPLDEALSTLPRDAVPGANLLTHLCALGERDGEARISVPTDTYQTSIYSDGVSESRPVRMARLDTLSTQGVIPAFDFLKIDVESYEPKVIQGALETLGRSDVLGIEIETTFNISSNFPRSHFLECHELLQPLGFVVLDMAFDRTATANGNGRLSTFNVLFGRDFPREHFDYDNYPRSLNRNPSAEKLIKWAMMMELYGMPEIGAQALRIDHPDLAARIDIQRGFELLHT